MTHLSWGRTFSRIGFTLSLDYQIWTENYIHCASLSFIFYLVFTFNSHGFVLKLWENTGIHLLRCNHFLHCFSPGLKIRSPSLQIVHFTCLILTISWKDINLFYSMVSPRCASEKLKFSRQNFVNLIASYLVCKLVAVVCKLHTFHLPHPNDSYINTSIFHSSKIFFSIWCKNDALFL